MQHTRDDLPKVGQPPGGAEPQDDIGRAAKIAGGLGVAFAIGALALSGGRAAASVSVGSAIAVANLLTMRAIIRALIRAPEPEAELEAETDEPAGETSASSAAPPEGRSGKKTPAEHRGAGKRGGVAWGIFAVLKITILFGGVWVLLTKDLVDPIPLVVGYGTLPLGIALGSLVSSLRPR